jgi:RND family efflux transporter MFP subunit
VYAGRGDRVNAGDVLAELDTTAVQEELLLAQQALTIAESRLQNSEAQRQRDQRRAEIQAEIAQLNLEQAVAEAAPTPSPSEQFQIRRLRLERELAQLDLDELSGDVDPALQADVEQAALRAGELEKLLESAVLTAPFSGEILAMNLSPGYAVAAYQPFGSLADLSRLEASARVRETHLEELSEGMPVQIMPGGKPGEAVSGVIRQLPYPYGSGGSGDAAETESRVRFAFDNPADAAAYSAGDRVDMVIVITERNDVLRLPSPAVRDFNGRKFIVVQDGDVQVRVDVELGIAGNGFVEILSGVEAGQTIVGQ